MYGYMLKDFLINKKKLLIYFGGLFVIVLLGLWICRCYNQEENPFMASLWLCNGILIVFLNFLVAGYVETEFFAADEKKKWGFYVISSEKGINDYLAGKYLLIGVVALVTFVICYIENALFSDVTDGVFSFTNLAYFMFFIQIFMRALDIPFVVAFGEKQGNNVKGIAIILLVILAVLYLLFGDISGFSMDKFMDSVIYVMQNGLSPQSILAFHIISYAILCFYYFSYRISCRLYRKGVNRYGG